MHVPSSSPSAGQPSTGHPAGAGGGLVGPGDGWFGGMPRITEPRLPNIPDIPLISWTPGPCIAINEDV